MGSFPVPGVINSLQFVSPGKGSLDGASWAWMQRDAPLPLNGGASMAKKSGPILLVAGVGQEPRLGRWVAVKEDGARNCSIVMALHPRTVL